MRKKTVQNVLISLASSFAIFAIASENIIKNGDLESIGNDNKFINWKHDSKVTVEEEGKNHFAKIENSEIGGYTSMSQSFDLNQDWEKLALSIKMKIISIEDNPKLKVGDVPRAMFIFSGSTNEKQYRPLCHLADKTDNEWVLRYEIIDIPADSKKCELRIDLPGIIAKFYVDDVAVYSDPSKIVPIEVLETAGKFEYRRIKKNVTPPGWIIDYNMSKMDNPPIRIEKEENNGFLRIENNDPTKTLVLDNFFSLDPSWKKINIKARIRTKNLKCGSEGWQDARVMVTFSDKMGQRVGGYGDCPAAKINQDWNNTSVIREIPTGAAAVRLQVGLFNSTGIADFDDISISKAE